MVNSGTDELEPTECTVFKEKLLYLFYGRPAYRVHANEDHRSDFQYLPVCFVLRPDAVKNPKRVFPFDTGAYSNKLYEQWIPLDFHLDEFSAPASLEDAGRIVDAFFGSNRKYYLGEVRPGIVLDFSLMAARSYYDLVCATGETRPDDRGYTIEIQTAEIVQLPSSVLSVALPSAAMDDPIIRHLLVNVWQAVPLTYAHFRATKPVEYRSVIREKIREYLERQGYL